MNTVPAGWRVDPAPGGAGVDMRVEPRGRGGVIAVFALLAGLAAWQGASDWPWLVPAAVLGALALWCAFADEIWHLEANCLVHRVGLDRWAWSRTYQDAVLDIEHRTSTNFNVPYSRLYAVVGSRRCFLFDRRHADEIGQLAALISRHTGWQLGGVSGT